MAIDYKPIGWDTSKFVNPSNLNKMDNGIKSACDGVDALNVEMDEANESLGKKVSKSGDTMSGDLKVVQSSANANVVAKSPTREIALCAQNSANGNKAGLWDGTVGNWIISSDKDGFVSVNGVASGLQTVDGAANRLMTQAYKGTKTTNDGRMYVQADYNSRHVIVGILGVGEVGVNKATGATYIGDGSKKYDQLHIRSCTNSNPHDNYMYLQQTKVGDEISVELGINGLGGIGTSRALCDRNGNRIDTTYAKLSASSERYKKNIKSVTDERVNNLMDIDIVTFDYIDSVGEGRKDNVGMLAEQIADKIPEAVVYAEVEGKIVPDKIDYAKFVPYLLAKIQMMQKEIDELKTR